MNKTINDVKLQIRYVNGVTTSGASAIKSVNYTKIKTDADDAALYAAGQAIASLQSLPLDGIRVVDVYDLEGE